MIRARSARALTAAALAGALLVASQAAAAPVDGETQFFLRQSACGAGNQSLSTTAGVGETQCGPQGGIPLNEVLHETGVVDKTVYTYSTSNGDGVPLVLDADRDIAGVVAAGEFIGGIGGVGESVVEITVSGTRLVNGRPRAETLGAVTSTQQVAPTSRRTLHEFALDVDQKFDEVTFTSFTISVAWRGKAYNRGQQGHNGSSWFTVPTVVDDGA